VLFVDVSRALISTVAISFGNIMNGAMAYNRRFGGDTTGQRCLGFTRPSLVSGYDQEQIDQCDLNMTMQAIPIYYLMTCVWLVVLTLRIQQRLRDP
jgi:hypothetical protein